MSEITDDGTRRYNLASFIKTLGRVRAHHGTSRGAARTLARWRLDRRPAFTSSEVEYFVRCRSRAYQGHPHAQARLAKLYARGIGVMRSAAEARRWYSLAAKQGDADAQYGLGEMLASDEFGPADYAGAVAWFRLASDQGHPDALYRLATLYDDGMGVAGDFAKAEALYRRAAEQRHGEACYCLGSMYATGRGVPQDDMAAYCWFVLASEFGTEAARDAYRLVARPMTKSQIAQARELARTYLKDLAPQVPRPRSGASYWDI